MIRCKRKHKQKPDRWTKKMIVFFRSNARKVINFQRPSDDWLILSVSKAFVGSTYSTTDLPLDYLQSVIIPFNQFLESYPQPLPRSYKYESRHSALSACKHEKNLTQHRKHAGWTPDLSKKTSCSGHTYWVACSTCYYAFWAASENPNATAHQNVIFLSPLERPAGR